MGVSPYRMLYGVEMRSIGSDLQTVTVYYSYT